MSTDELTTNMHQAMPFTALLGIAFEEAGAERVVARMPWRAELCTSAGLLHGGAVMALADSVGGACAFANLPEGATGTATVESKTNFLRAVREGTVTATATPLHAGRTVVVVVTDVTRDDGALVARVTQTQAVHRAGG